MPQISLKEFLITGTFGAVQLGATRQQIVDILGIPEGWGSQQEQMRAEIWVYGGVEFYFPRGGDGLYMIFSDHLDNLNSGEAFDLDSWIFSPELTPDVCEVALQHEHIAYHKAQNPDLNRIQLRLVSGVMISFHADDETSNYVLGSFSLMATPIMKMPMRQVSVTLPLHLYEKLRHKSVKEKRSIASLCADLLIEGLEQLPDDD